jgi:hypothetical protein
MERLAFALMAGVVLRQTINFGAGESIWRSPILQTHLIAESPLPSGLFLPATFFASARLELDAFCIHKAIFHPNRSLPFQIGTPEDLMIRSTPV